MNLLNSLIELFFPRLCVCCEERLSSGEQFICFACMANLPKTDHLKRDYNNLEDFFAGRFPFTRIAAFAYFTKGGSVQKIIHELKYRDRPQLGRFVGELCARELVNSPFLDGVDYIVPIPLHKNRLRKRGYNQTLLIAEGIASHTNIPVVDNNLVRIINNPSQTKSSRFERWKNSEGIFGIENPLLFENKHILLIDDVVTTGSTLEVCAKLILACPNSKISIYAIGVTTQ